MRNGKKREIILTVGQMFPGDAITGDVHAREIVLGGGTYNIYVRVFCSSKKWKKVNTVRKEELCLWGYWGINEVETK